MTKETNIFNNIDLSSIYEPGKFTQPYKIFYLVNGCIPSKIAFPGINDQKLFNAIVEHFPGSASSAIRSEDWKFENNAADFRSYVLPVTKDIYLYSSPMICGLELIYCYNSSKKILDKIKEIISNYQENQNAMTGKLFLMCCTSVGLDIKRFSLPPYNADFEMHYNNDFYDIHKSLIGKLNLPDEKGIVLLHGLPGTGKTSYIRYLNTLVNKRMIYVPAEMAKKIASPDFIPFMLNYPCSVFVIEDAEEILMDRNASGNSAVTNILNLADGLLSDCMNIQLICTFNNGLSAIDKALLRKGRIIARYEFTKLSAPRSRQLAEKIGLNIQVNEPMTLAEIYNAASPDFDVSHRQKIGFSIS